jgi:hypothetical protein
MASSVNFGTQQYFGFNPRTIPGCVLWLDAIDSNTVFSDFAGTTLATPGGAVARWNDKSGLGNHVSQGTAGNRPTLSNIPSSNAYGAIYFATTAAQLTGINNNPQTGNLSRTMFFIMHLPNTSSRFTAGTGTHSAGTPPTVFGVDNSPGIPTLWAPYVYTAVDNVFNVQVIGTRYVYMYHNSAISQLGGGYDFTNSNTKSTTLNTIADPWRFGQRADAQGSTTSYLCEVILYNSALTTDQRQQVEGYLTWKWNLQSTLPTSHPYRAFNPVVRQFQPVDVPGGALLWLDAADTTTITGSTVTQWRDKSGRGSNAVTGLGSVVAGTAINSRNTLRFGLNTTLNLSNFVMPTAQTSLFYVFRGITVNANTGQGTGYFILSRTTDNFLVYTGNQQFFSYQNTPAGRSYNAVMGPGGGGERNWGNLPTTAFVNATSVISMTGISYSSSNGLALPQVAAGTIANTVFTASTYQISSSRNIGDVNTYDLGELIVCDGTVSIPIAQQIEGYLAWKWGVRNSLPTTHPYFTAMPSTALFTPHQLSGLVLWMDPMDSTTLTLTGSSVSQWRDKSTTGAVFNNVFGPPTYSTTLINGLPGINLTNQCGFISAATHTLTNSLTLAMILVVKSGIDAWGSFFTHGNRDLDIALERNSISTGTTLHFQTANDNATGDITFTTDEVSLYLGTMTTGTSRFFERFGGRTTTSVTATNSSTIVVGSKSIRIGRSDGNENCDSFIGEIVYYNRVLTTAERQELEGYLTWKWGLQASLPSTHPYAKFRP